MSFVMLRLKRMWFGGTALLILLCYMAVWRNTSLGSANPQVVISSTATEKTIVDESLFNNTGGICSMSYEDRRKNVASEEDLPVIYFVTPTYSRPLQMAELLRVGQTILHVPKIYWILVEDSQNCSSHLTLFLERLGLPYTHMINPMPEVYRKEPIQPRGVSNRRAALSWIRNNVPAGVVYFGDDDNTYDLRLFDEIRDTKKVSMLPVGLIGEYGISSPIVENGIIVGFFDPWPAGRLFPIDMAGFAVNVEILHEFPNATIPYKAGYEEDEFLQSLSVKVTDIEPKASNCTEILVWHTHSVQVKPPVLRLPSDGKAAGLLQPLFNGMKQMGLASFSIKDRYENSSESRQQVNGNLSLWSVFRFLSNQDIKICFFVIRSAYYPSGEEKSRIVIPFGELRHFQQFPR